MTKKAATEAELGALHSKVAKVMSNALDVFEKAQEVYLDADNETAAELSPPEVPSSLMGVITKFLNDNKISCVPEESAGLSNLEQRLMQRRRDREKRTGTDGNVVSMFPQPGMDEDE